MTSLDTVDIRVVGLGVQYPENRISPDDLDDLIDRHYPDSKTLKKLSIINRSTKINSRPAILQTADEILNRKSPPSIAELDKVFLSEGVKLSVTACQQALKNWGGDAVEITHMVSVTCTNTANPGYDHYVAEELGLSHYVERTLLHGVGCSGGILAMRTACTQALAATAVGRKARVLVLACELCSLFGRSELESAYQERKTSVGVCLFSDCASACIISNGIGEGEKGRRFHSAERQSTLRVRGWHGESIKHSSEDLGFHADPCGWKFVLSPRVPGIAAKAIRPAYQSLVAAIPSIHTLAGGLPSTKDFNWAVHPGGSSILAGVQDALDLRVQDMAASWHVYLENGNSSSATILSVLNQLWQKSSQDSPLSTEPECKARVVMAP
ncbi:hypothetical protein M409DRAFT_25004 [Zasmidium cellare ATCC 36951]|uniref:Chalcone/stilbene synthase N-terminal domain-containing protein n=1 Tax=Zasmidium cellare ATCC 36951 TaxID=1080233 RepID=A0A6A6CEL4_ZASCE|nr:uncharacterized protein M409DRAFT_25004 [Zasmidium cellare ATCC 36951]KAF2164608.1 hypothetical protein M409DRAFT_25004 [Zasmidium cellare ATCC 36951]